MTDDIIELDFGEQLVCKVMAHLRHYNNRFEKIPNLQRSPNDWNLLELNGLGAEMAFCKKFNIYPDFSIGIRNPYDVKTNDNLKIDIKFTSREDGDLLVCSYKNGVSVDGYALLTGQFPIYRLVGFASSKQVFNSPKKDYGHGENFVVHQTDLVKPQAGKIHLEK